MKLRQVVLVDWTEQKGYKALAAAVPRDWRAYFSRRAFWRLLKI
jgi:hypothetical protein